MAGKGIEIDIAANTRDFQRGTKDVETALSGVSDALDDATRDAERAGDKMGDSFKDVARDADKAGDKLGDEFKDGAKDAERSVEKLENSFKDVADASRRETGRAGDAMKKNTSEATDAAKRDLGELKDEAMQNASETFSSFDGSVDSFVDGIQGTFGGIVSNMGPLGAALGAALALGLGTAVAKGEEAAEAINSAKERVAELAGELIEVDGDLSQIQLSEKFNEWGLEIEDSRKWFEFWQDDAKTAFEVAQEKAEEFGVSVDDLALGLSGIDASAATRSMEELTDQVEELQKQRVEAMGDETQLAMLGSEIRERENLIEKLEKQGGLTEKGIALQEDMTAASEKAREQDEANAAALEARNDAIGALQGQLDGAIGSWSEYVDAETGALDPAAYIEGMAARIDATASFNDNVAWMTEKFNLSAEEQQAILDQGLDFAQPLQDIIDSGMAPEYIAQIQRAVDGGQELVDGLDLNTTVNADADTKNAEGKLDSASEDRDSTVHADADTRKAENELDRTTKKKRTAKITADAQTTRAENQLRRTARPRNARIIPQVNTYMAESQLSRLTRPRTVQITADVRDRRGKPI